MPDVAVVGAGLAGLCLVEELRRHGLDAHVFEARERAGGRILSQAPSAGEAAFRFDLGPSWIWPEAQPHMARLIDRLGLNVYEQWQQGASLYMATREAPPQTYTGEDAYAGACRIKGGAWTLVEAMLQRLPADCLHLGHRLEALGDQGRYVELRFSTQGQEVKVAAQRVVLTLPPRLLAASVTFLPALDEKLRAVMDATPTWMAGHAKAVVRYERAFWRDAGLSGSAFAVYPGAAWREIYDAGSPDGEIAALSGFFGLPAPLRRQYRDDLEALTLEQLVRLFGPAAASPEEILFKDWCDDAFTAVPEDQSPPASHPQYGHPWLQLDHWNDKLYFGGTETAPGFGGYLEGALESAARIARGLLLVT